jgi:hypothetical protein
VGLFIGAAVLGLLGLAGTLGVPFEARHRTESLLALVRIPLLFAAAWGAFQWARRLGDQRVPLPDHSALEALKALYIRNGLAGRAGGRRCRQSLRWTVRHRSARRLLEH